MYMYVQQVPSTKYGVCFLPRLTSPRISFAFSNLIIFLFRFPALLPSPGPLDLPAGFSV